MTDKKVDEPPRGRREGSEVFGSGSKQDGYRTSASGKVISLGRIDQSTTAAESAQGRTDPQRVAEEFQLRRQGRRERYAKLVAAYRTLKRNRPVPKGSRGASWSAHDTRLLRLLERCAAWFYGGHLTVLKFTTNWRVQLGTPWEFNYFHREREAITAIEQMPHGRTFAEAAEKALAQALNCNGED